MHPDHVGGVAPGDIVAFPNAVVRADKQEADYWLSQTNMEKAPADSKSFFQGAIASLSPYIATNKFQPFDADMELTPGVRSYAHQPRSHGRSHHVRHRKQGQEARLDGGFSPRGCGPNGRPSVTIAFDTDTKGAAARQKAFKAAAKGDSLVGTAHLQFPGVAICVQLANCISGSP